MLVTSSIPLSRDMSLKHGESTFQEFVGSCLNRLLWLTMISQNLFRDLADTR